MYATTKTTTKTTNKSTPPVLTIDDDEYPFDYDVYFYSLAGSSLDPAHNEFVAYIDRYRLRSKLGQLRARFNLELKFFMSLKSLRLDYMNSLSVMEQQQQQPPRFTRTISANAKKTNNKQTARPKLSSIRKMSSSPASSTSKIPHLVGNRPASVDESVSAMATPQTIKRGEQTMSQRHLNHHQHHHRELRINNTNNRFNHHMARKSFLPVRINASASNTITTNNVSAANVVTTTNASQSPSSLSSFSPSSSSSSNLDAANSQASANLLIRVQFFFYHNLKNF